MGELDQIALIEKAALLTRTRAQRIPFRPGDRYSNKGRIHSRRPILPPSFFACKTAAEHTFRVIGWLTLLSIPLVFALRGFKAGGEPPARH
jgi:hypothetical protein